MKKSVIFFLGLAAFGLINAQNSNSSLIKKISREANENRKRFSLFIEKNRTTLNQDQIKEMQSKFAGFVGNQPFFWESDDKPGNRSANLTPLQTGTLTGLNNTVITGSGINILVMDGGRAHNTHQEFGGNVNGPLKVVNMEATTVSKSDHATNVTGIILGSGGFSGTISWSDGTSSLVSDAQGVLKNATSKNYAFTDTDLGTNYQKLATYGENISNHSYGINLGWAYRTTPVKGWYWVGNYDFSKEDTWSGSYYTPDANFDEIVYANPNQIVIKSAGNYFGDGPDGVLPNYKLNSSGTTYVLFDPADVLPVANCSKGYNCIGWGSLAKNIIVVGATYQLLTSDNLYTSSTDVIKADFSSAGPRKDGAIKPDISAVGVDIISPTYSSTSPSANNYYTKGGGTSYSAPIISGITGAVTQVNRTITGNSTFTYKADEMKALLTHTANEAGNPGPDVWYGWGFADATKAAQLAIDKKDKKAYFERNLLNSGVKFSKVITSKAGEPLKATISWVDPAATPFTTDDDLQNNNASRLVNDLDLRIIDNITGVTYFPWKLNIADPMANATQGDNLVDNVEQVLLTSPVAGRSYTIEVSNKGTLVNDSNVASPQNYALIITGIEESSLSTNDISSEKLVSVYPTKTKDFVNILIPNGAKEIEIFDISGKSVLQNVAKGFQTINMEKLPKGVYIINIKTTNGSISKKVIKE